MKSNRSKSKKRSFFSFRMPTSLKRTLELEAKARGISLNSHLCNILFNYLHDEKDAGSDIDQEIKGIRDDLSDLKTQRESLMAEIDLISHRAAHENQTSEEKERRVLELLENLRYPLSELAIANEFQNMGVLEVWGILSNLKESGRISLNDEGKWYI